MWKAGKYGVARKTPDGAVGVVTPAKCQAAQYSDMMRCLTCRTSWDTNDSEPPPCPVTGGTAPQSGRS